MKVRWREHEMILVTILAAIKLSGYIWQLNNGALQSFEEPFENNHVPFSLFRNAVLPDIGMGLLAYLAYLVINLFTIPRLLFPKKTEGGVSKISVSLKKISLRGMAAKLLRKFSWLIIQVVLIGFVLGTALNVATYYKHEWQFHYPGFSIFNNNTPNSQINVFANYPGVLFLMILYFFYACLREFIINFIERRDARRDYRVMITNQVTVFLVIYISIPFLVVVFRLIHEGFFITGYFSVIIPVFLVIMTNIYWLFPLKGDRSFFSPYIILRLLSSTFIASIPFLLSAFHEGLAFAFLVCWAAQLFVVTPISWLFYELRKDKILQLRGVQKELVKSRMDMQFLRSQINPHFLFNVLNTLYGTALQEKAEKSASGIQKLGDMMRFMLHENNLDFIQMSREIEYLKNYISLQKLRTQSSSQIIIEDNIDEQNCHHRIAPMLLIPFVENAFKHGISLQEASWIKINLHCSEKDIRFEVRNSTHPKTENDPEKERSGIGFKNVLERLKLIYPGKFDISFNADEKEFFVKLSIQP